MTDLAKVSILINKLMALARDDGATEAEAALAAEKAQALMTEHNLSMANIEAAGGQSGEEGQRVKDGVSHRQVYKWQRELMRAVADLNFCYCTEQVKYHARTTSFNGYQLIGRAANVVSTRTMFEYLVQTIERLAREDVQDPKGYFTRYAHSFKEGCADRVVDRLRQRRDEEVARQERKAREEKARSAHPGAATGNALAVVLGDYVQDEKDLNEDFRRGWPAGTTKSKRLEHEAEWLQYQQEARERREIRRAILLSDRPELDPEGELFDWLLDGFDEESYNRMNAPRKEETEAQRRKRKEKEQREHDRWWNQENRKNSKKDWAGYSKGQQAGDSVGLDKQVDRTDRKGIT